MYNKPIKCTCGDDKNEPLQPCPYNEEINNNNDLVCNCCSYCTYQCCMDI